MNKKRSQRSQRETKRQKVQLNKKKKRSQAKKQKKIAECRSRLFIVVFVESHLSTAILQTRTLIHAKNGLIRVILI
jgi:sulfur transfer protein SufE